MKYVLLLYFIWLCSVGFSQEITKYVISSTGGHDHLSTVNVDLHWSLGELTGTLISNTETQIQQGFHQIYLMSVPIYEWNDQGPGISVFPNPTPGLLSLRQDDVLRYTITIRDLYGRIVLADVFESQQKDIDLEKFPDQTLLLTLESENLQRGYKIIKMSH